MSVAAAAFYDVASADRRDLPFRESRRVIRFVVNGIGTGVAVAAALGLLVITVTLAAAWIVNNTLASDPHIYARVAMGPATLALTQDAPTLAGGLDLSFADKWAQATASMPARAVPLLPPQSAENATNMTLPNPARVAQLSPAAAPVSEADDAVSLPPKRPAEHADILPLPRPYPGEREITTASIGKIDPPPAPKIAAAAPLPVEKPVAPKGPPPAPADNRVATREVPEKSKALLAPDSRTAVYDISARTVYLPNGSRLEAHSGLGDKMDDPRYVKVRMRGPTPPNIYNLTLREELFHGVRAIRLNPIDDDKMYGRAGMLAHTSMLGPNGQSNGCVSFKDYDKFLHAFLKGEVNRMVVVAHLDELPRVALERRGHVDRFASNF
jgi:hypothetical protein